MAADRSSRRASWKRNNIVFALIIGLCAAAIGQAGAQSISDRIARQNDRPGSGQKRLLVEAKEVVYDKDNNTVAAVGDATLYYDGKVLQADRVRYDRASNRVYAEGNAKLTDEKGVVYYGDRFELTDDFKDGFIDSVRMVTPQNERLSAPRAERTDGETTVFDKGTYTACLPCKEHPERPPLWQVRAARIIHKNAEQTIYYENATLEFFGFPLAWIPFFSAPDPTVKRRTGFLTPKFISTTTLGYGAKIPFFWAVTPSTDITFSPTFLSRQGLLASAEWRQRLEYGRYNIRASGIFQQDRGAFIQAPFGAGNRTFRGALESEGFYNINRNWRIGWDLALSTDKFYFQNYRQRSESFDTNYLGIRESVSQIYLSGQSPKTFFDLRAYYFRGLTVLDWQKQQAVVHPVFDYNRRFAAPGIGGELSVTANFTSLSREAPHFTETAPFAFPGVPARLIIADYLVRGKPPLTAGLYDGCVTYTQPNCLLRGIGGSYARATLDIAWRRQFIDPAGQVWTPFASLRGDAAWKDVDTSRYAGLPGGYSSAVQSSFIDTNSNFTGRVMPTLGLEYRFPFFAQTSWASHIIEPIAQIIARPNETGIGKLPNEDAQSLVFDDTVLFRQNKFSGYDRVEGGIRANTGIRYTANFTGGGNASLLFGQSYQLAGRNSFAQHDLTNTGINSGLDRTRSDYIASASFTTGNDFNVSAKARFDERSFRLNRIDVSAAKTFRFDDAKFLRYASFGAIYSRIEPQPRLGYDLRREGLYLTSNVGLPNNFFVTASVLFDLDRYKYDRQLNRFDPVAFPFLLKDTPVRPAATTLGIGYIDECTTFVVTYQKSQSENASGIRARTHTLLVRLELKHLGQASFKQNELVTPGQTLQR